jgi:hypothetical protein
MDNYIISIKVLSLRRLCFLLQEPFDILSQIERWGLGFVTLKRYAFMVDQKLGYEKKNNLVPVSMTKRRTLSKRNINLDIKSRTKVPSNVHRPIRVRYQWLDERKNLPRLRTIDIRFIKENQLLSHVRVEFLNKF